MKSPYDYTPEQLGLNGWGVLLYRLGMLHVHPWQNGRHTRYDVRLRRWHPLFWVLNVVAVIISVPMGTWKAWKKNLPELWS